MFRLLILFAVIFVIYLAVKRLYLEGTNNNSKTENNDSNKISSKNMLKCTHCQIHSPENLGVFHEGKFYCNEEHKNLDLNH